jgi:hypothetical protein
MTIRIDTPRGSVIRSENGLTATLTWNPGFGSQWSAQYNDAQKFVDSEILRLCEPYIPLLTGMMIMSGILGTDVGSGVVQWIAPYSRNRYYSPTPVGTHSGPMRGPFWFERMKTASGAKIIEGARRIAGGSASLNSTRGG